MDEPEQTEFERAAESGDAGFLAELWDFLANNKKWWLLPIVITLLIVGLLVLVPAAATPFIYTLF